MTTKSFIIALGLTEGHLSVEEAASCAQVEVQSQINRWGEVEDSASSLSLSCDVYHQSTHPTDSA